MNFRRPKQIAAAVLAFAAFAFGSVRTASAQFYVSDVGSNSIKSFDATGRYTGVFASGGGLSVPYGLTFGPDKNLYVASLATHEILRYNGQTGVFIDKFVTRGGGAGEMYYPNQVVFGPDNNMYVSSFTSHGNGAILEYDGTTGAFIKTFASNPGMVGPTGFGFNPIDGNLYAVSSANNSIFKFDGSSGSLIGSGPFVSDNAHLNGPAGIDFGPDGNIYAASFFGASTGVQRYDGSTGQFIDTFTKSTNLNGPVSVIFGNDFNMYVTSYRGNTVRRFNSLTGQVDNSFTLTNNPNLINPTYMTFAPSGISSPLNPVPEPSSMALLGLGAAGLMVWSRRRRQTV